MYTPLTANQDSTTFHWPLCVSSSLFLSMRSLTLHTDGHVLLRGNMYVLTFLARSLPTNNIPSRRHLCLKNGQRYPRVSLTLHLVNFH